jgi:hypothetical protein
LAALSRIRSLVEQIPAQAVPSAEATPAIQEGAGVNAADAVTASRPLQELAGLRQMAEVTSQGTTENINARRVDRLGAALRRLMESTVDPPNAIQPRQPVADALEVGADNHWSYNRAILEMLRGGFETARRVVPAVEEQRASFLEAMRFRRAEARRRELPASVEQPEGQAFAAIVTRAEAEALGLFAEASHIAQGRPPQAPYPVAGRMAEQAGSQLNFLV